MDPSQMVHSKIMTIPDRFPNSNLPRFPAFPMALSRHEYDSGIIYICLHSQMRSANTLEALGHESTQSRGIQNPSAAEGISVSMSSLSAQSYSSSSSIFWYNRFLRISTPQPGSRHVNPTPSWLLILFKLTRSHRNLKCRFRRRWTKRNHLTTQPSKTAPHYPPQKPQRPKQLTSIPDIPQSFTPS